MSRIGKKIIVLPPGVSVAITDKAVAVKGPKGELTVVLPPKVSVTQTDNELAVAGVGAFWGLGRSLVANAVIGVAEGYVKKLELNGVGYKVALKGADLTLALGFSHPVEFKSPAGITLGVEGNVISVSGIDKQLVGETAARLKSLKPVEPYKGKGIKYVGQFVRRKAGKVAKGSAG